MDAHPGTSPLRQGGPQAGSSLRTPQQRGWAELFIQPRSRVFLSHRPRGSGEARRHWWGPAAVERHGGSKPQQFGPNSASPTKRTGKVCAPWGDWGSLDTSSRLLHVALGKKKSLTGSCVTVESNRHRSANTNGSPGQERYRELRSVQSH